MGLRTVHYDTVTKNWPKNVDWFEVISENYMDSGGRPLEILEQVRAHYPIALHGVSLSIGSADPLNKEYLKKLKTLADRIEPAIVSDHLCWTGIDGKNLHDLLPLPYTEEAAKYTIKRVKRAQDFLGRKILLENVSTYFTYKHSRLTEWDFLTLVAKESGCGILLDVNNAYVNAKNHDFDPYTYLKNIPAEIVGQFHLAGHTDMGDYLFDTHSKHVIDEVWDLYRYAVQKFGQVSTLVEWDENIPDFEKLSQELEKARMVSRSANFTGPAACGTLPCSFVTSVRTARGRGLASGVTPKIRNPKNIPLFKLQKLMKESILPSKRSRKAAGIFGKSLNRQGKSPGVKRIAVYADGYIARMHEGLVETFPAVKRILGDAEFLALAHLYAEAFPSEEYSLNQAGKHFPRFVGKSSYTKKLSFLKDLAELEWKIRESFHAFEKDPADLEKLKELPPEAWQKLKFIFQPTVFLVRSQWPILDIWNARSQPLGKININLVDRPQNVFIHRQDLIVRCELMGPQEADLLQSLLSGRSLGRSIELLSKNIGANDPELSAWFAGWSVKKIIQSWK